MTHPGRLVGLAVPRMHGELVQTAVEFHIWLLWRGHRQSAK